MNRRKLYAAIAMMLGTVLLLTVVVCAYGTSMYKNATENAVPIVSRPEEPDQPGTGDADISDPELTDTPPDVSEPQDMQPIYEAEQKLPEVVNILLVGLDTRSYNENSHSDTIILASYNTDTHMLKLVSMLRDSWVKLSGRGWSRINAATVYGGIGELINTVNENFDLDVQDYIQVKFSDFAEIVDLMGGVELELTQAEIDYINWKQHSDDGNYKNDVTAGPGLVLLNGRQALWQCRNRSVGNADWSRTNRQRVFLEAALRQMMDRNPLELMGLLEDVSTRVSTNMQMDTLQLLVTDVLAHKSELTVEAYHLPFDDTWHYANKNGASVVELDIEANTRLLHEALGMTELREEDSGV